MKENEVNKSYETPRIEDHGTLQDLTAACAGGSGGDAFMAQGAYGGFSFGTTNPAYDCTSK